MIAILFILINLSLNITASLNAVAVISSNYSNETVDDYDKILCRGCGIDLASSQNIISKLSPSSQQSFLDTLFNTENVLIQILLSEFFFNFPVITTTHSSCVGVGEWEDSENWFPDYQWKPCVCSECGTYVGWVFKPIDLDISDPDTFFVLILTNIISETFLDSTIIYPK
ncbi:protein cereblon homolog [Bombyx mandarina]|uniref:Protein cereblon homolog n=1 Tax=Bombyx mandarina TaxID=7092 RepID=A0A6J2KDE7_BOMMA|nr:protein cereblon homolog [Bombyx mandarina]